MVDHNQQNEPFFSAALDPAELQIILDRIDENLTFRQVIQKENQPPNADHFEVGEPPSLGSLIALSDWLKMSSAPLRPSLGMGGPRGLILRFLNLPVRFFGSAAINFNRKLRDFIGELITSLLAFQTQINGLRSDVQDHQDMLKTKLHSLETSDNANHQEIFTIYERIKDLRQDLNFAIGKLDEQEQNLTRRESQRIVETQLSIESVNKWCEALDERQRGTENWIKLIADEMQGVAKETRALKGDHAAQIAVPNIFNPNEFARKIREMDGSIKVNVGSGSKPVDGYINVDFRELPGIDLVCDAVHLPFPPETLDEIASSHLVEHFREYELTTRVLPTWFSLIKKGGNLRVICPNWQVMIDRLQSGTMPFPQFKLLTFGGQDYDGNDHFAMYTPSTLSQLLQDTGFSQIQVLEVDRDNGGCPEMELLATKPA